MGRFALTPSLEGQRFCGLPARGQSFLEFRLRRQVVLEATHELVGESDLAS